ncbi:MAG TPA: hypothetical protein DDY78_29945 [Planctomycetales bacterium]|jgi:hypothetical protein|nr:hypothetical protein [Planctomycetales bacterium]
MPDETVSAAGAMFLIRPKEVDETLASGGIAKVAFGVFAGIATLAAVLYIGFMPETKDAKAA